MARVLTSRQKKVLDKIAEESPDVVDVEGLLEEEWDKLVDINDNELLWQNVDRYLSDKAMERICFTFASKSKI